MKFHPIISIILGITAAVSIFGISMLIFGETSWIPGAVFIFAFILGGFIATYFTKIKRTRYGIYVGIIFAAMLFILGMGSYTESDISWAIFMPVLFSVLTGIGGFLGKIIDKNRGPNFKIEDKLADNMPQSKKERKIAKAIERSNKRKAEYKTNKIEERNEQKTEYTSYKPINSSSIPKVKTEHKNKPPSNVIYCPQCGLEDSNNSRLCTSCGENLKSGRNYLKTTTFLRYVSIALFLMFFISLIIAGNEIDLGDYSAAILPIIVIILVSITIITEKLILPRLGDHARIYCPKCENKANDDRYCIKCGYNLENVLGCFSGNIRVDLYDIELNKNYINLYRHIIERQADGPGEYHERLAPQTLSIGGIRNMRLSKCKTLIIFTKPCLKFDYWGSTVEFKMDKKTIAKVNKILSTGVYDDLISRDGPFDNNLNY